MTPDPRSRQHLRAELQRLDLLLTRYLSSWRADRGGPGEGGGLYVSDAQVDRLLESDPLGSDRIETDSTQTDQTQTDQTGRGPGGTDASEPSGTSGPHADQPNRPRQDQFGGTAGGSTEAQQHQAHGHPDTWAAVSDDSASEGPSAPSLDDRLEEATAALDEYWTADETLPLVVLAERFGLERRHVDALLVVLAPELDLKYEPVYAYLQDDLTRKRPTVGLVLRVVGGTAGDELAERSLFTPGSPLLDDGLVHPARTEGALLSQPVEVDRRIVGFLLGEDALPDELTDVASMVPTSPSDQVLTAPGTSDADDALARLPVPETTRSRLASIRADVDGDPPALLALDGTYGSGRTAAAAALAESINQPLLALDADRLPAPGSDVATILRRFVRDARLRDAAVLVRNVQPPTPDADRVDIEELLRHLDACPGPVFLSGDATVPPRIAAGLTRHRFATVSFEQPDYELRRSFWTQLDLPGDPAALASKFRFTAGQIEDAAETARGLTSGPVTASDVQEACRAQSRDTLGDLVTHLEPNYGWEDIVLPSAERRGLRAVAAHIDHRGTVYSEWGFAERFSLGTGVNALFAGPSGTGKTMAAEIIAAETGLDLYRVDLANVVSKYIGETESNLAQVFDEAQNSNAVLFFDEADALFGERSEVSDAHDRYANIEVDYLLQRMEAHDGVVLLATNLDQHLDDAFRRRIDVTIDFPRPDRDAREQIWRGIFPDDTPVGNLDWVFLADFELTGGDIKSAALTAAFLAADEGDETSVEMRHVVDALWRELRSRGRLVTPEDFGDYREYVV